MSEFTFEDDCIKDADADWPFKLEFAECEGVAILWERNEQYILNEKIRPSTPNGFAMRVSAAGTSGAEEPVWPTTLSGTVTDGSVTWTAIAAGSNGVSSIAAPTYTVTPSGLTVSDLAVDEGTALTGKYVGGVEGSEYEVKYSFTVNGLARVARHVVKIRKQ